MCKCEGELGTPQGMLKLLDIFLSDYDRISKYVEEKIEEEKDYSEEETSSDGREVSSEEETSSELEN